jgi:hypothetical protein
MKSSPKTSVIQTVSDGLATVFTHENNEERLINGGFKPETGGLVRKTGGYKSESIVMENKSTVTEHKGDGYSTPSIVSMRKSIGFSQNSIGYFN